MRARRHFALLPRERPGAGMRRIALGQLELAGELLDGNGAAAPDAHAVHEVRKALKRLRALVRLLEDELGAEVYARENRALRDTGRRLSAARDAEVMLATLDALRARHPRSLGSRDDILTLRRLLLAERDAAAARVLADTALLAQVHYDVDAIRARVLLWQLGDAHDLGALEPGLERIYRQGRSRYERAARGKRDRGRALHEWRKRVKDLRHAAEALQRSEPDNGRAGSRRGARDAGGRRARKQRALERRLTRIARRADQLGEILGEEHDLAVLGARVQARTGRDPLGKRSRRLLVKRIARRRRKLRKRALRRGAKLYQRRPKRFVRRVRAAFAASARR